MEQANKTAEQARDAEVKPFPVRTEAEAPVAPVARKGGPKRLILGAVVLVAVGFAGHAGYGYWTVGRFMVATDDAYLKADITAIAPKVLGYVQKIAVTENQPLKAGDLLMQLDDGDYQNALKAAQSQVVTQDVTIKRIAAQVEAAKASDPLLLAARRLLELGATPAQIAAIDAQAQSEIDAALRQADNPADNPKNKETKHED